MALDNLLSDRFQIEIWVEQCFRDILKIVWGMTSPENLTDFHNRVPITKRLSFCFVACNQFILSRDMMRRRPLSVWKKLYEVDELMSLSFFGITSECAHQIIVEQDTCHVGEPDYPNLFTFNETGKRVGPETANVR